MLLMEIQNKKIQKKTHSEKNNFSSNNIVMENNLDMVILQKLWNEDIVEHNLNKMKKDDIHDIIKSKSLKSKLYLEQNLFKFARGGFAYFVDDHIVFQKTIKILKDTIPKPLLIWFRYNPVLYKKISDPTLEQINYEKRIINTYNN